MSAKSGEAVDPRTRSSRASRCRRATTWSSTRRSSTTCGRRRTKTIDISDFVELAAIDPIYYDHTYWLGADGESGAKAYRLLLAAMEDAQRVGIGTVVMRNKQYLAAIRPLDGALAMSTMHFADEIVPVARVDGVPSGRSKPAAKELRLASQIIDALTSDWDPAQYHDTYTEQLRDLSPPRPRARTSPSRPRRRNRARRSST